jgi:hypothetical protein
VANVVRNPYSNTAGNTPPSLGNGQIGINQADGRLYYRASNGTVTTFSSIASYATVASFPATGSTSILYLASDSSRLYQWTGSVYAEAGVSGGGGSGGTPESHAASHAAYGSDPLTLTSSQISDFATAAAAAAPATTNASLLTSGKLNDSLLSSNVVLANNAALTDARTPTGHAASHASGGSDALTLSASQVSGLGSLATANSVAYSSLTGLPSSFSPSSHSHDANDITGGMMATARLGTGTANATTYLRGDQTYAAVVNEFETTSNFPASGASAVTYIATDTGRTYRFTGSVYVEIGSTPTTASEGDPLLRALFVPPAPTGVTASSGNAQVSLTWIAPVVSAQTPITDYTVQFSANSGSTWTTFTRAVSAATSATVSGLTNGTAYVFRVAATNALGQGAYSSASSSATPSSFFQTAVVLASGSSYTVPSGATSLKAWAVGQGGVGGTQDNRAGGSGAVAYKTWSVNGGQSISYTAGNRTVWDYQAAGLSSTVTFGGTTITANGAPSIYLSSAGATFSGGDGGANGSAGVVGLSVGRGINSSTQQAVDVDGLLSAVALAVSQGNAPAGVTADNFGDGGAINLAATSRPPIGGGGQGAGTDSANSNGGSGAVVFLFS